MLRCGLILSSIRTEFMHNFCKNWVAKHVRQSQYVLQVVRCTDIICCGDWRSNWTAVVHSRFLPAPYPLQQTSAGFCIPTPSDHVKMDSKNTPFVSLSTRLSLRLISNAAKGMKEVPYELYCPKVQEKIKERMCPKCGRNFPSKTAKTRHGKANDLILVPKPY